MILQKLHTSVNPQSKSKQAQAAQQEGISSLRYRRYKEGEELSFYEYNMNIKRM